MDESHKLKFLSEHTIPPLQIVHRHPSIVISCSSSSSDLSNCSHNSEEDISSMNESVSSIADWSCTEFTEKINTTRLPLDNMEIFNESYTTREDKLMQNSDGKIRTITMTPIPESRVYFQNRNSLSLYMQSNELNNSLVPQENSSFETNALTNIDIKQNSTEGWWEVEADLSEVKPHLYLGTYKGSLNRTLLEEAGITHIIQAVEVEVNPHSDHFRYYNVCISDTVDQDMAQHFEECSDYIHKALQSDTNSKIFIHCGSGISRSAALVIAYMMKYDPAFQFQFKPTYEYLKTKRCQVKPNRGFKKQLLLFQDKLMRQQSNS